MTVKIVTDSTCDLPEALIRQYDITVIPLLIIVGEKTYRDTIDISRQDFYARLPGFKPTATTAAPGIDVFRQTYENLASHGATEILSIHISEKLSGTVNIARKGAEETKNVPVTVLDSRQLSSGTGFEVLSAAKAAASGQSMQEILSMLDEQIRRTHVFAALDTVEFLRRSGRMHFALARLGEILQIKPVLKMYEGNPTAERVRTRKGAMKRLVELLQEFAPYEKVAMLHSGASERAHELLEQVRQYLPEGEVFLEEINPALGAHLGPGVIGFACISKQ